jgi:hypothetical protein
MAISDICIPLLKERNDVTGGALAPRPTSDGRLSSPPNDKAQQRRPR